MSDWPAAVLFDFDGVIVDSEPLHLRAFQEVLLGEGITLTESEYYREMIGFDDRGAFRYLLAKHRRSLDERSFARLLRLKSAAVTEYIRRREYGALPGVDAFVRGLSKHYPLAICSGALRHEIESMLDGVSLRDCFPTIVSAEDVEIGKPDPMGYLLAARLVGERTGRTILPHQCLIVEDAPSVARTTRAAGFSVLAVATSYPLDQLVDANWAVPSLNPEEVLQHLPQLRLPGSTAR
jgi:beta-phosphoglucomutase